MRAPPPLISNSSLCYPADRFLARIALNEQFGTVKPRDPEEMVISSYESDTPSRVNCRHTEPWLVSLLASQQDQIISISAILRSYYSTYDKTCLTVAEALILSFDTLSLPRDVSNSQLMSIGLRVGLCCTRWPLGPKLIE